MQIVNLLPLSRAEIRGKKPTFLKAAFAGKIDKPAETMIGASLVEAMLIGGYPEMLHRKDSKRRQRWALDYVKAIVQRDVRDIAELEKLDQMPRLLQVLATHSGQLTNFTQIGAQIGFDDKTTRKYVGILEQLFLVRRSGAPVPEPVETVGEDARAAFLGLRPAGWAFVSYCRTNFARPVDPRAIVGDVCLWRGLKAGLLLG